jgi:hypothetical protein
MQEQVVRVRPLANPRREVPLTRVLVHTVSISFSMTACDGPVMPTVRPKAMSSRIWSAAV